MLLFLMNFDRMTLPHLHAAFKTQHADAVPPLCSPQCPIFSFEKQKRLTKQRKISFSVL